MTPDSRLINLQTSGTRSGEPWRDKGIQYRSFGRGLALTMLDMALESRVPVEMHARMMMDKGNLRGGNCGNRYCGSKIS